MNNAGWRWLEHKNTIHTRGLVGRSKNSPPLFCLFYLYDTRASMAQRPSRPASSNFTHDARVARDAEEPGAIVGHSLHTRHASECTMVCDTGQPPRLTTTFNRAHLLQLDLDPDQTRSATSTPWSPRSNTIGNFNSLITPISKNTHNTPGTHHDVIIDLPLIMTLTPTQANEVH
jgi:hypothetical protein